MCCRCRSLALAPNASLPARANATNAPAPITIIAVRCRVGQLSSHRRTLSFGNRPCPTSKTAADRRRPKLSDCTSLVALCRHRCDSSSSHFFFFFFLPALMVMSSPSPTCTFLWPSLLQVFARPGSWEPSRLVTIGQGTTSLHTTSELTPGRASCSFSFYHSTN
ncbi:hypothetical protein HDK77DRAFT_296872 [Phyllosticta capitalensis]